MQLKWLHLLESKADTGKYLETRHIFARPGKVEQYPSPKVRLKTIGMQSRWLHVLESKGDERKFKKLRKLGDVITWMAACADEQVPMLFL